MLSAPFITTQPLSSRPVCHMLKRAERVDMFVRTRRADSDEHATWQLGTTLRVLWDRDVDRLFAFISPSSVENRYFDKVWLDWPYFEPLVAVMLYLSAL